jgi:hypothetical protein
MKPQIILGMLLLCLNLSLFAQTIPAYVPEEDSVNIAYKNRLAALFENVDLSLVPSGVLYEHGFPFIAIEAFTGQFADSSKANSMTFGLAYASIASMTVDSLLDLPGPEAYTNVFDTITPNSNVIPIVGLHQVYHTLDSAALDDSLFNMVDSNLVDV